MQIRQMGRTEGGPPAPGYIPAVAFTANVDDRHQVPRRRHGVEWTIAQASPFNWPGVGCARGETPGEALGQHRTEDRQPLVPGVAECLVRDPCSDGFADEGAPMTPATSGKSSTISRTKAIGSIRKPVTIKKTGTNRDLPRNPNFGSPACHVLRH
jgi:hypothetical protein